MSKTTLDAITTALVQGIESSELNDEESSILMLTLIRHPIFTQATEQEQHECQNLFINAIGKAASKGTTHVSDLMIQYEQLGIIVEPSVGPESYAFSVTHWHDDVPYALYHNSAKVGDFNSESFDRNVQHIKPLIARYHHTIKAIYEYLKTKVEGDLWVMSGGGCQLQAFFTNHTGYLGILYLGMVDAEDKIDSQYMKAIGNTSMSLQPNFGYNVPLFKGMKIPGVKVTRP